MNQIQKPSSGFQWMLAALSICIMASVISIMTWALRWQIRMLDLVSQSMLARLGESDSSLIVYIAMANFAVLKTCALCFGFVLIFLGSVYVLWPSHIPFELRVENGLQKTGLKTASPGLVMIALGVGLTALIVFYKANLAMSDKSYVPAASLSSSMQIDPSSPRQDLTETKK
jgi:hypothetical protein